jgi:hypothetical protein
MSALLLQINLDLQAGSSLNILNTIESSVDKIVGKLQQFSNFFKGNPINVVTPQQLDIVNNLANTIKLVDNIGLSINNNNIEEVARRKQLLDMHIAQANILKKSVETVQGLNDAFKKQQGYNEQFEDFHDKSKKYYEKNKKDLNFILKHKVSMINLTKSEVKEFNSFVKSLKLAAELGGVHVKQLGEAGKNAKELYHAMSNVEVNIVNQVSLWNQISNAVRKIIGIIPGIGILIAVLDNPLSVIKQSLEEMKDLWAKNNKVSNNFLFGAEGQSNRLGQSLFETMQNISSAGGAMREEFKEFGVDIGDNIITMDQTRKAVDAVLASSHKGIIQNNKQLGIYASLTAQTARATGLADSAVADLILKYSMLSDTIGGIKDPNIRMKQSAVLTNTLVNVTAKYSFSVEETATVVSLLNKNMMFLNKNFKVDSELAKLGITSASAFAGTLSALGDAAKKAGHDSRVAMEAFSSGIEDPLGNILLLQDAVNSTDPTEQMLAMGKNAADWAAIIEDNPMLRGQARQMFGKSYEELTAMRDAYTELNKTAAKNADGSIDMIALQKKLADEQTANEAKTAANSDANNKLTEALDKLRIIFGRLASAVQPFIDGLAYLISIPGAPYIIALTGAFAGLYTVIKMVSTIKSLGSIFGDVAAKAKSLTTSIKGGGGTGALGSFATGVKDFINTLGEIKIVGAIKAAASIAIVGVGLAAGVAALGLAAKLLPPDKAAQLAVTVGGIVAASWILSKMSSVGPKAIAGAALVAAVGVSLAIGTWALGKASEGITLEQTGILGIITGGLLIVTGLCALMAPLVPLAIVGAAGLAVVGGLLAVGIWAIGEAVSSFGEDTIVALSNLFDVIASIPVSAGLALSGMALGLTAFAAALTGGAIFSFFSGGMVNNAMEMATAMQLLLDPIIKLGNIGDQVSKSFVSIAEGLKVFVEAINDSSGWFSSFEGKAEKVASAMRKIAAPMKDMAGGVTTNVNSEEIKKGLALTIESSNKSNKEIVDELKEIKKLLVGNTEKVIADKIDKSIEVLNKIFNEMRIGSGFGSTSANTDYAG